jgi:hypothetical protein
MRCASRHVSRVWPGPGLSGVTGTQAGDVSRAVGEQAPRDDGDDAVELGEREQESDAECGDVAWTGAEPVVARIHCIRGKKKKSVE